MKVINRIISTLAVSVIFAGIFISINILPAQADLVQPDECLPAVLMLRGSGETQLPDDSRIYKKENNSYIETNGYEGRKISQLLRQFTDRTNPASTVSKTRFIGVDYEALPIFPDYEKIETPTTFSLKTTQHIINYQDSYNNGGEKVLDIIKNDEARGCNTQYMLVGYSQGAISARIAIELLDENEDKILSTYLIGDPLNKGNVDLSERQVSPAHATSDEDGIIRTGLTGIRNTQLSSGAGIPLALRTQLYLHKLTSSDSIVYRDDPISSMYSRNLCHDGDLICDTWIGSGMENHNNYFDRKINSTDPDGMGDIDLQYEVEAFDQQVQALANSQSSNPRARVLKKTPSVNTSTTLYNLANSQPGDTCSWDEGNNGTYEQTNIPCEIYEYENNSQTERLRVKVTDTYGSNYFFELEDEVLEVEQIEHALTLDPNSWYQFKSKSRVINNKAQCVDWYWQEPTYLIDVYGWTIDLIDCKNNLQGGNAFDALQVFKPTKEGIKSGYDDDYSWGQDEILPDYLSLTPHDNNNFNFKPVLTEIINNTPYYSFRHENNCVTAANKITDDNKLSIMPCNINKDTQLFEALMIKGDFGSLSIEKDTTPPKEPTNLFFQVDNYGSGELIWDKVEDRGVETSYEIYELTHNPTHYEIITVVYNAERIANTGVGYLEDGEQATYSVRAQDEAGLYSPYSNLTTTRPDPVKKPTKPVLLNIQSDNSNVTLTLPIYNASKIRGVRVYDNDEYLGTYTGTTVTLPVIPGTTHNYTYRYEVNDQIVSVLSNKLKVIIPTN